MTCSTEPPPSKARTGLVTHPLSWDKSKVRVLSARYWITLDTASTTEVVEQGSFKIPAAHRAATAYYDSNNNGQFDPTSEPASQCSFAPSLRCELALNRTIAVRRHLDDQAKMFPDATNEDHQLILKAYDKYGLSYHDAEICLDGRCAQQEDGKELRLGNCNPAPGNTYAKLKTAEGNKSSPVKYGLPMRTTFSSDTSQGTTRLSISTSLSIDRLQVSIVSDQMTALWSTDADKTDLLVDGGSASLTIPWQTPKAKAIKIHAVHLEAGPDSQKAVSEAITLVDIADLTSRHQQTP